MTFRLVEPGLSDDELNGLNRRFLQAVNDRRRIFISHGVVGGKYVLRICVLSFRTHMPTMEIALEDFRSVVDELTEN